MNIKLLALVLITCVSHHSLLQANDEPTINDIAYGGTGCPQGSVSIVTTPEFDSVRMVFDEYAVDSENSPIGRETKTCDVAISVYVPSNVRVGLTALGYRGFYDIDRAAYATLKSDHFFAGQPSGNTFQQEWSPDEEVVNNYHIKNTLDDEDILWSPCGVDVITRVSTMLSADRGNGGWSVLGLYSASLEAGISYEFQWEACSE